VNTGIRWWVCLGLVACGCGRAWGQDPSDSPAGATGELPGAAELAAMAIDPGLAALVERLEDPSYASREEATARLLRASFDNDELYAVLTQRVLTAEQRHRLLSVVRERLLHTPRGAVGIKVEQRSMRNNQIVVEQLLPGLPGRDVLLVGDRITHLDHEPLPSWETFVRKVQSRRPGAKITLSVERLVSGRRPMDGDDAGAGEEPRYERLEVELELGSTDRLLDPVTGRPPTGGPVVSLRQREADLARMRFGGVPRLIKVDEP
jgi:hypothetical protein